MVKYIYKYICKGHDEIAFSIHNNDSNVEIYKMKEYQVARWVSVPKVSWYLFSFPISEITPTISQLQLHIKTLVFIL